MCFSTLGATNGTIFGAARLTLASAREGHLMKTLSYCDVKRKTPSTAIYFLTLLSCAYVLPGNFSELLNYFSFAAWLFYGMTVLGVITMRFTQPDRERPFRVPLLIPSLFVIIAAYLVVAPVVNDFELAYVYALLFILSGLLIYYLPVIHCKYSFSFMSPVIEFFQLLLAVAPVSYNQEEADVKLQNGSPDQQSSSRQEVDA